ncbi:MAG: DUF1295 domain-containing protein [Planctomycetes bacterium]|nr:DUF1295 domain-containing protein [Planctomycetota bacterium]
MALFRVVSYGAYLASSALLVWFVEFKVDRPAVTGGTVRSLLVDAALLALFALQHSGMARESFKRRFTSDRSLYVLLSSLALGALCGLWQPLPGTIWELRGAARVAMFVVSGLGWLLAAVATAQVDPFLGIWGRREGPLRTRGLFGIVRHPAYLGMLVVFWAAETMTWTHLVLTAGFTVYLAVGIALEERGLSATYGAEYAEYRERVPALLPLGRPPCR